MNRDGSSGGAGTGPGGGSGSGSGSTNTGGGAGTGPSKDALRMKLRLITIAAVTLTGIGLTDNWFVALMAMYLFVSLTLTALIRQRTTPDRPSSAPARAWQPPSPTRNGRTGLSGSVGPNSLLVALPVDRASR